MDYTLLTPEVASRLAAHPDWTDQQVADDLNAPTIAVPAQASVFVRYRTLIGAYGTAFADAVADALDAAAAAGPFQKTLKRILPTFYGDSDSSGVDMANATVRQAIDAITGDPTANPPTGILTVDQASKIKALGQVQISRAQQLGLPFIYAGYVASARSTPPQQ